MKYECAKEDQVLEHEPNWQWHKDRHDKCIKTSADIIFEIWNFCSTYKCDKSIIQQTKWTLLFCWENVSMPFIISDAGPNNGVGT